MKKLGLSILPALLLGGALTLASAEAATVTLGFSSLPSSQGWTFSDNSPTPESAVFSIVGNTLHQNAMSQGVPYFLAGYTMPGVVTNAPFTLSATMRVTSNEIFYGGVYGNTGISFGAEVNGYEFAVLAGPGAIIVASPGGYNDSVLASTSVDTTIFHNYVVHADPIVGSFSLSVDGTTIFSGQGDPVPLVDNSLFLGDFSSRDNAIGDYSAFTYTTDLTSAVPEPSTWAMMILGFAGVGFMAYRRKSQKVSMAA